MYPTKKHLHDIYNQLHQHGQLYNIKKDLWLPLEN